MQTTVVLRSRARKDSSTPAAVVVVIIGAVVVVVPGAPDGCAGAVGSCEGRAAFEDAAVEDRFVEVAVELGGSVWLVRETIVSLSYTLGDGVVSC